MKFWSEISELGKFLDEVLWCDFGFEKILNEAL